MAERRDFLAALTGAALLPAGLRAQTGASAQRGGVARRTPNHPLTFDAMGELRPEYDRALIADMLASGLNAIAITLCDPKPVGDEALALAFDSLLAHERWLGERADQILKARRVVDIDRARAEGKLAVFYLFQNTAPFGRSLDRIDAFHRLGLSSCQLTYNTRNEVGVGCWEEGGLTAFGHEVIGRMNGLRMLVDLSHANMQTMREAAVASKAPIIVSHTACQAVHANRRNTTDEVMRAVADRGGVIGICQMRPFLTEKKTDNLGAYFDHILHAIRVSGIDHVAIGSDRDHRVITLSPDYIAELKREEGAQVVDNELPYFIDALNGPRRMEVVRRGLAERGLKSGEVDKVMGANLRRLYADVIG